MLQIGACCENVAERRTAETLCAGSLSTQPSFLMLYLVSLSRLLAISSFPPGAPRLSHLVQAMMQTV